MANARSEVSTRHERAKVWRLDVLGGMTLMHVHYSRQRFRPHRHEEFTLGAIFDGLFGIEVDGSYRKIPAGTFSFLPPHALHTGECLSSELQYRTIYISRPALELLAGLRPGGDWTVAFADAAPHDERLIADFVAAHERLEAAPECMVRASDLEDVLAEIVRRFAVVRAATRLHQRSARQNSVVRAALDLLNTSYQRRLDLDELARRAGVSVFHFLRLFKRETALTPHAYLICRRVKRAKELLLSGLPPAEVAVAVGFYDQSHLTRHFKSVVGATPGEFVAARFRPYGSPRSQLPVAAVARSS